MNKKTIRRALKRAEYMNSIGKLGATGYYFNGDSYCIIGCLFSDDLIQYFNENFMGFYTIGGLYRKYQKLDQLLGMSSLEAQDLQDINDNESPQKALEKLREWAK